MWQFKSGNKSAVYGALTLDVQEKVYAMRESTMYLADFRKIMIDKRRILPQDMIDFHTSDLAWLKTELDKPFDGKTVVVTHHLPSANSVAFRFVDELSCAGFASNLDYLFGERVALWVHGHTHDNFDYTTNGTRVVCNPRGYVTNRGCENNEFDDGLIIEIDNGALLKLMALTC